MGAGLRADTIKIIKLSIKHPIVLTAIPGNWFLRCQENPKGAGAVRALPPSLPLFDHCRRCARRRAAGTLHLDTCDKLLFFRVFFGGGGRGKARRFLLFCCCCCSCGVVWVFWVFLRNDKTVPIYRTATVLPKCPQRYHFYPILLY